MSADPDRDADSDAAASSGDPLERLFAESIEKIREGGPAALDEFCRRYPEHAERMRRGLGLLDRAGFADPPPSTPPPEVPPVRLGDFRVRREIGRGAMGVVYEAEQISLRRTVALKVLPHHLTLADAAIGRFRREAKTAAKLRHPNIVEIHSVGDAAGTHYFAMEFVVGAPLDRVVRRLQEEGVDGLTGLRLKAIVEALSNRPSNGGPASPPPADSEPASSIWTKSYVEAAVRVAADVADALQHAHEAGVVHRDVKPSNILLRPNGHVALTDFGLARDSDLPSMSRTGEFAGTPHYVSPEQALGLRDRIGARADVFSLGVTLYELLTLRLPFEGSSSQDVLSKVITKDPPSPQKVNPRLATDLATIVMKAIEKDPDRRYASAAALAEDLRAFLAYRPIQARPTHALRRAWLAVRRSRAAVVAISAVLLAATALAAIAAASHFIRSGRASDAEAKARAAIDAGRLDDAEAALAELAQADPGSPALDAARRALAGARFDARLRDCDAGLDSLEALCHRVAGLEEEIALANAEATRTFVPRERYEQLLSLRRSAEPVRGDVRLAFARTTAALEDARTGAARAGGEAEEAVRLRLARHFAIEREFATRTGQAEWARSALQRLAEYDTERTYLAALEAPARLAIEADPGYDVHLFRYVERADVGRADPSRRLVPAPYSLASRSVNLGPFGADLRPGDPCLVVEADWRDAESGLLAGDLIVAVDGTSRAEGFSVLETSPGGHADASGVRPFDRLRSAGGAPVEHWFDVRSAQWNAETVAVEFDSPDGAKRLAMPGGPARLSESLGLRIDRAARILRDAVPRREVRLTVIRDGIERAVTIPPGAKPGIVAVETAYPLVRDPVASLGKPPLARLDLAAGRYLVLLSRPGGSSLRVPVTIEAGRDKTVAVKGPRHASPSPTAIWVPGGRVVVGERLDLDFVAERREVDVGGFWMERFELTAAEWRQFLDSPEVAREIEATHASEGRWIRIPREIGGAPAKEPTQDFKEAAPAKRIDYLDARAFVAWKNERLREAGTPFEAALPSEAEWERAAGGESDRLFPWGDEFEPQLTEAYYTHPQQVAEPIGTHIRDESPFGIRDMGGSGQEFVRDPVENAPGHCVIKGGSSAHLRGSDFAIDYRSLAPEGVLQGWVAIRLVYFEK